MRVGLLPVAVLAAFAAGCDAPADDPPPPPPELSGSAGLPPPAVKPPLAPCPPYPPGFEPPPGAPSAEDCARESAERLAADRALREERQRGFDALGAVPFAERKQHPARQGMGGWINALHPVRNGVCRFAEKPKGSKPADYSLSAFSGNIDLWTRGDSLLHDHAIGFVEAYFGSDEPVVAVRQGLPDLWITPVARKEPSDVVLFIGEDRFECVRTGG